MKPQIHFVAMLRSPVSWAKVGREVVEALSEEGAYVSAAAIKGFLYDEGFALSEAVEAAARRRRRAGWELAVDYPPNFSRLRPPRRAGILICEADRFPPHWADAVRRYLEVAFVPSRFCLEAAVRSGVPEEMLVHAPLGVNARIYRRAEAGAAGRPAPEAALTARALTGRTFNFLTVGAPHVRKGLRETAAAFREAFSPAEDAGLVIKCPPLAGLGRRPWEYARTEDFLPEGRSRRVSVEQARASAGWSAAREAGQVTLCEGVLGEDEMAALYRSADVYVQASYGEGFGLAALEAAACGAAVVTTAWGAAGEFFDASRAFIVAGEPFEASRIAYDWPERGGEVYMSRPRAESLAAAMRRAYDDQEGRETRRADALRAAGGMTWRKTAAEIVAALTDKEM